MGVAGMTCPRCGSWHTVEITSLGQAQGVHLCQPCGMRFSDVEFRPHRYSPPLLYMRDSHWGAIYCGPPARYPAVPTPEDLLYGAGLDPWPTLGYGGGDHAGEDSRRAYRQGPW